MDTYCVLCDVETELYVSYRLKERGSLKIRFVEFQTQFFGCDWLYQVVAGSHPLCCHTKNSIPSKETK
jgi:hypothetical protein